MHSEQKYEELLQILDALHKYVPKKSSEEQVTTNGTTHTITRENTHQLLLGGDQLTAARCRGCKCIRVNSATESMKSSGLHPVCEDWHAKVILLEVYK